MGEQRCPPYTNLAALHEWLCKRAGSDSIAIYRLKDASEAMGLSKSAVSVYLKRLTRCGGIERRDMIWVEGDRCRVDLVHTTLIPVPYEAMEKIAKERPEKQRYRPLPELKGYRDPYECSGPLLGHLKAKADKNSVVSFNLDELTDFGREDIILATVNYLFFKKKIASVRPPENGFKNYNVKILETPHA